MAEGMTIQIEGMKELDDRLQKLQRKAQKKVLRKALAAGGRVIVKDAKKRAPVGKGKKAGKLKKAISAKATVRSGGGRPIKVPSGEIIYVKSKAESSINIGFDRKAFYGQFHELGTSRIPARSFLRPAMDTQKDAAVNAFKSIMAAAIEKVEQDDA